MCLKHEEQVQQYEKDIKKREDQMLEMEHAYQSRLRAQENVQNMLRQEARDLMD
jgi:hypothetical protein